MKNELSRQIGFSNTQRWKQAISKMNFLSDLMAVGRWMIAFGGRGSEVLGEYAQGGVLRGEWLKLRGREPGGKAKQPGEKFL